jgi:hypothetical protein
MIKFPNLSFLKVKPKSNAKEQKIKNELKEMFKKVSKVSKDFEGLN